MTPAGYILAMVGAGFLALAAWRITRGRRIDPASRTWLIVAAIFLAVSGVLWTSAG
jgi:hypothetical protein